MKKETIEKIAIWLCGNFGFNTGFYYAKLDDGGKRIWLDHAKKFYEYVESLGYVSPDKVIKVIGNELEYFIEVSALEKWVANRGYVQKAKDQSLPENPFEGYLDVTENIRMAKSQGFERCKQFMLTPKDGCVWVKVIVERE